MNILLVVLATAVAFAFWILAGEGGFYIILLLLGIWRIEKIVSCRSRTQDPRKSGEKSGNSIQVLKSDAADAREAQADETEADDESE
jgi:hypothetical protein